MNTLDDANLKLAAVAEFFEACWSTRASSNMRKKTMSPLQPKHKTERTDGRDNELSSTVPPRSCARTSRTWDGEKASGIYNHGGERGGKADARGGHVPGAGQPDPRPELTA
jgi:hypothetical protein